MEEFRLQFAEQVTVFAKNWFTDTTKLYVAKYNEITLNMTKGKLARMKAKVNDLVANADRIVGKTLADPAVWWHLAPKKHEYYAQYEQLGDKYPEVVDKAVRRALGELGTVLGEFGFGVTTAGAVKGVYPEFWFESLEDSEMSTVRPFYPHLLAWPTEMQDTIRQYDAFFRRAIAAFNEMEILKEEKKKQQARDLWEST